MIRWKVCWLLTLGIFVAGCSGGYDRYVGLWERTDAMQRAVLEIKRDGKTYLVIENVLAAVDLLGNKPKGVVLTKQDGMLVVNTGFGSVVFGLSGDEQVLHFADQSYRRIDSQRLEAVRQEIKDEALAREQSLQRCKVLKEKYRRVYRDAVDAGEVRDLGSKLALVDRLESRFDDEKRQAKLPDCYLGAIFF